MTRKFIMLLATLMVAFLVNAEGNKINEEGINVDINFEASSDVINESSFSILDQLANDLKDSEYTGKYFLIEGHTDKTGDFTKNLELSKKRALSVKSYLSKNGISDSQFVIRNYGSTKPIIDEDTPEAYAKNRRVAIKLRSSKNIETMKNIVAFRGKNVTFKNVVIKDGGVEAQVAYGTDRKTIVPEIKISGAKIEPDSGTKQDFTNPVTYKVIAEDGSEKVYTIVITERPEVLKEVKTVILRKQILADGQDFVLLNALMFNQDDLIYKGPINEKIKFFINGNEYPEQKYSTNVPGIIKVTSSVGGLVSKEILIEFFSDATKIGATVPVFYISKK